MLEKKMTPIEAQEALDQTVMLDSGKGFLRPAKVLRVTVFDEMAEVRIWFESQRRWAKRSTWVPTSSLHSHS